LKEEGKVKGGGKREGRNEGEEMCDVMGFSLTYLGGREDEGAVKGGKRKEERGERGGKEGGKGCTWGFSLT
jgi:hypothetical protein